MSTDPTGFGHCRLVFGTVANVTHDPTQTGMARVRWQLGGAQDELDQNNLPWSQLLFPAHNTNYKQIGGPHVGLTVNSHVVGLAVGGDFQDVLVIGSMVTQGNSTVDDPKPQANSEIPQGAKVQQVQDFKQPLYGDYAMDSTADTKDPKPRSESVVLYAQNQGGNKQVARYWPLKDSIGHMSAIA